MAKPSRGGAHFAASKKKAKRRTGPLPEARVVKSPESQETPQVRENGRGATAVQFRPKAREAGAARPGSWREGASGKAFQQVVDYSYVYTDLKIIGVLAVALLAGMIALSFVLR